MNSNFDDLLSEFLDPPSTKISAPKTQKPKTDIDDFLEELKTVEKFEPTRRAVPVPVEERKKSIQKCYPVVVSGHSTTGYCMSSSNMIACDKLRCTRCDLPVKRFGSRSWKPESEYLFFRNNFSRDDKLATMMNNIAGSAAYSCQCLWRNASDAVSINGEAWVCGGHLV